MRAITRTLTTADLAERWQTSERKVKILREMSRGPEWFRVGHSVRYLMEDVIRYEDQQKFAAPGADAAGPLLPAGRRFADLDALEPTRWAG